MCTLQRKALRFGSGKNTYAESVYGSMGEVTREGSIIVVSHDDYERLYRVYCLRFTGT